MKGDFSRDTFDPFKHFSRVLIQQGRVQLDADSNEQVSILLHYLRTLATDLIGPYGGPQDNYGFEITEKPGTKDLAIGPGRYYVDGILCEVNLIPTQVTFPKIDGGPWEVKLPFLPTGTPQFRAGDAITILIDKKRFEVIARNVKPTINSLEFDPLPKIGGVGAGTQLNLMLPWTYQHQPDLPNPAVLENGKTYLVYLDVWERHITPIEDGSIREVALGEMVDTAMRAKVVWQVNVYDVSGEEQPTREWVNKNWKDWLAKWQPTNRGLLKAKCKEDITDDTNPCVTSPDSHYRGSENQLYRVEIHDGNWLNAKKKPTFKWSRENGSVAFLIRSIAGKDIFLEHLGCDERYGLKEQDWVEIVDDESVLHGKPGIMGQVKSINREDIAVTLKLPEDLDVPQYTEEMANNKHALLRRWDHKEGIPKKGGLELENGAVTFEEGTWLTLEDGVQIEFQKTTNRYRTGDYWLIPARTITGDVEWPGPVGQPNAVPPHGVEHHYAPLAIISVGSDGKVTRKADLRCSIKESRECL